MLTYTGAGSMKILITMVSLFNLQHILMVELAANRNLIAPCISEYCPEKQQKTFRRLGKKSSPSFKGPTGDV